MTLYEIDTAMQALIDEDGMIADYEAFEALALDRDKKIENSALWVKNMTAEAAAIKAEETALADRRKVLESRISSFKKYLATMLDGQKFTTPKVALGFTKSTRLETQDEDTVREYLQKIGREDLLKYSAPTLDKTAIKAAVKGGATFPGVELVEYKNLQIK